MKKIKKFGIALGLIACVVIAGLIWFFVGNKAPITQGNVDFHIRYNSDQRLDIYHPTKSKYKKTPVVLFFHGGAWITGRKESINLNRFNGAINNLRDAGYLVISPEYTLAEEGKTPFPDCIVDGFDCIHWIEQHADSLNIDLNNFGLIGESAGAHIAMMNAYSKPEDFELSYAPTSVDYVVDVYGPNDLWGLYHTQLVDSIEHVLDKLPESIRVSLDLPQQLFGFNPEEDPIRARMFADKFSPFGYLNAHTNVPPTCIIHGDADILVPIEQSKKLHAKLKDLEVKSELRILPEVNHAFQGASDEQKEQIQRWITDFVQKQYVAPAKKE